MKSAKDLARTAHRWGRPIQVWSNCIPMALEVAFAHVGPALHPAHLTTAKKRLLRRSSTAKNDAACFFHEERRIFSRAAATHAMERKSQSASFLSDLVICLILTIRLRFQGGFSVMRRWGRAINPSSSLFATRRSHGRRSLTESARKIAFRAAPALPRF